MSGPRAGPRVGALSSRRATSVFTPSAVWVAVHVSVMRSVWACRGHQRTPLRGGARSLIALLGLGRARRPALRRMGSVRSVPAGESSGALGL